jgi:hypothetical protein
MQISQRVEPPRILWGWCVLGFVLAVAASAATPSDEGVPLRIDVRSKVDDKWIGFRKLPTKAHGKLYYLAQVMEVAGFEPLVRSVNTAALSAQLHAELAKRGFRAIGAQEKPDVILTVGFGRGYLRNPYTEDAMVDELTPGTPTATITSPSQIMRQRSFDGEGRLQKAQEEKLYITVSAWQYPERKGEKPNLLWRTVAVTDNPDTRDLNAAMPAMLAAGADYFDQTIKDGEVTINTTMPRGNVTLGPLEVLQPAKPGK